MSTADEEVERVLQFLKSVEPNTEEYEAAVNNFKTLCEARSKKPWRLMDFDVLLPVAANLVGILVILNYERCNVLVSKALGFVGRK